MQWLARLRTDWSWRHPGWGVALGLWIAVADIALTPPETNETYSYVATTRFFSLAAATAVTVAIALSGWFRWGQRGHLVAMGVAVVGAIVAVVAANSAVPFIYNSYDMPAARFAILPAIAGAVGVLGIGLWYTRRQPHAEIIMVAALTTGALVAFVQPASLVWGFSLGLAMTYVWLWPELSAFSRNAGLALHFLALLGFLQQRPEWFEWTPFPFLTFAPLFILGQYARTHDGPRRVTWWVGFALGAGSVLLGISTLIGNLRKGLPVWDPLIMLAGGALWAGLLYALLRREGETLQIPFLARPAS